jgi:hypothetical protein
MRELIGISNFQRALMLMLIMSVPGCKSQPYEPGVYYEPQPALVEVVHRAAGQPQEAPLTVLASVRGIRRADQKVGIPTSAEIRLRLENHGPSHVEFDPGSLELTTGALRNFPPPRVQPPAPVELSPGQNQAITADFPLSGGLDEGSAELDHLRLRWRVTINGQAVPQTVLFVREREGEYSNDPVDQ